jgi:hypothetical protein
LVATLPEHQVLPHLVSATQTQFENVLNPEEVFDESMENTAI